MGQPWNSSGPDLTASLLLAAMEALNEEEQLWTITV